MLKNIKLLLEKLYKPMSSNAQDKTYTKVLKMVAIKKCY